MRLDPSKKFDVIVIGAGLNGTSCALELSQSGMKVLIVDAGHLIDPSFFSDDSSHSNIFDIRNHIFRLKLLLKGDISGAMSKTLTKKTWEFFLSRNTYPYSTTDGVSYDWPRARVVGGRGHFWGRACLRFTDKELRRPNAKWPISYDDLKTYYDELDVLLNVGGAAADTPEANFQHARTLNRLEQVFVDGVRAGDHPRKGIVNTVAGYDPSPTAPFLDTAIATGNVDLLSGHLALRIHADGGTAGQTRIELLNVSTGQTIFAEAPNIVVAASSFETVSILLRSRTGKHPEGIGNSSGLLGKRILEHMMGGANALLPKSLRLKQPVYSYDPLKLNAEPHGFYIPPSDATRINGRGYGIQGSISEHTGLFYAGTFGEPDPENDNLLSLSGISPSSSTTGHANIRFNWSKDDLELHDMAQQEVKELIDRFESNLGTKLIHPALSRAHDSTINKTLPASSNHESGGARMGSDPATSVVDPFNRIWDQPNILVCDASCFPSLPHQNPTFSAMALGKRACRELARA